MKFKVENHQLSNRNYCLIFIYVLLTKWPWIVPSMGIRRDRSKKEEKTLEINKILNIPKGTLHLYLNIEK